MRYLARVMGERFKRHLFRSAFKELPRKTWGDYMEESLGSALKEFLRKTLGDYVEESLGSA